MLQTSKATSSQTFRARVKVRFPTEKTDVFNEGDFVAIFKKKTPDDVQKMSDENWTNLEVLEEVLEGVEEVGNSPTDLLPPDEAKAFVLADMFCVPAMVTTFFRKMAPEQASGKTSRKQR